MKDRFNIKPDLSLLADLPSASPSDIFCPDFSKLPTGNAKVSFKHTTAQKKSISYDILFCNLEQTLHKYTQILAAYMDYLHESSFARQYLKRSKFRARFVSYYFSSLMRSCVGTHTVFAEEVLDLCGAFDYEQELTKDKWLVPLTGSLYNDIRTNFVAKYAQNASVEDSLFLLQEILSRIIGQHCGNLRSTLTFRSKLPLMPDPADDEHFEPIAQLFADQKPQTQPDGKEPSIEAIFATQPIAEEVVGWGRLLRPDYDQLTDLVFPECFQPMIGCIDSRMTDPDRALFGLNLTAILSEKPVVNFELGRVDFEYTYLSDKVIPSIQASLDFASLIDRERLEYTREKERQAARRKEQTREDKLLKELEKLKQENACLREAASVGKASAAEHAAALAAKDRKIQAAEAKNKQLERALKDAESSYNRISETLSRVAAEHSAQETEIEMLQRQLSAQSEGADNAPDAPLDTSVFDNLKIVVVGGHPTWAAPMRTLHPNVKIYNSDDNAPDDALLSADVIWVQTNSMSHSTFHKVCAASRNNGIPLKYFAYAGHQTCKRQIVTETREMFPGPAER